MADLAISAASVLHAKMFPYGQAAIYIALPDPRALTADVHDTRLIAALVVQ